VRKRHFLRHLYIKCIILPRQARDEHRENSNKVPFSLSSTACFTHGLAYGVNAGILEKSAFAPVRRKSPFWLPFAFKNDQFAKTGSGQTQEKLSKKAVRVLHAGGAKSLGLFDEGRGAEQYRTAGILPATRGRSREC
jgi:hypothetical protein